MTIRTAGMVLTALVGLSAPALAFTPTLLDQTASCGVSNTISQEYEASASSFTSFLADDLVVAPDDHGWEVTSLFVNGSYSPEVEMPAVNVFFYKNVGGTPSEPVSLCQYEDLTSFSDAAGDLTISLSPACTLRVAGDESTKYWVSVQARLDVTGGGGWYWLNRLLQANSPAAWLNPGDGWGTPCEIWGRRAADCGIAPEAPDQCFAVLGFLGIFASSFELGGTSRWSDAVVN